MPNATPPMHTTGMARIVWAKLISFVLQPQIHKNCNSTHIQGMHRVMLMYSHVWGAELVCIGEELTPSKAEFTETCPLAASSSCHFKLVWMLLCLTICACVCVCVPMAFQCTRDQPVYTCSGSGTFRWVYWITKPFHVKCSWQHRPMCTAKYTKERHYKRWMVLQLCTLLTQHSPWWCPPVFFAKVRRNINGENVITTSRSCRQHFKVWYSIPVATEYIFSIYLSVFLYTKLPIVYPLSEKGS